MLKYIKLVLLLSFPLLFSGSLRSPDSFRVVEILDTNYLSIPGRFMYQAELFSCKEGYIAIETQARQVFLFSKNFTLQFAFETSDKRMTNLTLRNVLKYSFSSRSSFNQTELLLGVRGFIELPDGYGIQTGSNLFVFSKQGFFRYRHRFHLKWDNHSYHNHPVSFIYYSSAQQIIGSYIFRSGLLIEHIKRKPELFKTEPLLAVFDYPLKRNNRIKYVLGNYDSAYHANTDLIYNLRTSFYFNDNKSELYISQQAKPSVKVLSLAGNPVLTFGEAGRHINTSVFATSQDLNHYSGDLEYNYYWRSNHYGSPYLNSETGDFYRLYWRGIDSAEVSAGKQIKETYLQIYNKDHELICDQKINPSRKILKQEGDTLYVFGGFLPDNKRDGFYRNTIYKYLIRTAGK
ncbi:MAG TPA: hypothetical protein VI731_10985 [Bacteroidia bacterium]|nr:hypothetical protein [Bacteroidia bacterium]